MPPRFGGAPSCVRCQKAVYMAEQVIGPSGAYHKSCLTCKECNKRLDSTILTEREGEAYCNVCHSRKWGIKGYGFAGGASFLSTEDKMPKDILESQQQQQRQQELFSPPSTPSRIGTNSNSNTTPTLPARPAASEIQQSTHDTSHLDSKVHESVPIPSFWSNKSSQPASSTAPTPAAAQVAATNANDQSLAQQPTLPPRPSIVNNSTGLKAPYVSYQTGYVPKKLNFGIQNDTCTKCGKAVYAAELALGAGNRYHKMCLKCCQCGKLLNSTNMQDRDSDLYCRGCYSKSFGPKGYGYGNLLTTEGATR